MSKTKLNSFVSQFIAIIEGDKAAIQGEKTWRQAESAFKVHIAALNGDLIAKEDAVTAAEKKLTKLLVKNGNEITDRIAYIQGLLDGQKEIDAAKEVLKKHQDAIAFLEAQYEKLKKEV